MGIQGSGKSTQGNILSKKLSIPYLSTGHIFREMAKEKTPLGRYVKETINAGYLIPDEKTIPIVEGYLKKPDYQKGYILDGFPRTVKQAEDFHNGIDKVLYLKVSDKEALWRLSSRNDNREDATLAGIRKRIELFHKITEPVLDYFSKMGILEEINGERDIEDIHRDIMSRLKIKAV